MIALDHSFIPARACGWLVLSRNSGVLRYDRLRAPREDRAVRWPVKGSRARIVLAMNVLSAAELPDCIAKLGNYAAGYYALRAMRVLRTLGVARED